ncbi:MAG: 50S ribosomal protein L9, partial [Treponema sp.]|nr:50S ribosomal protein L9 [Treponema sp.]
EELARQGFQVERKKIEIPGNTIKSVGKYRITVKLYESAAAECALTVEGQPLKTESKAPPPRGRRPRNETETENAAPVGETAEGRTPAPETAGSAAEQAAPETAAAE